MRVVAICGVALVLAFCIGWQAAWSKVPLLTPQIYVNGSCTLAEALKRGKVVLTYDVRAVGGQGIELVIDVLPHDPQQKDYYKTIYLQGTHGNVPLDFYDEEPGLYGIFARACDAKGKVIAKATHVVTLRYGEEQAFKAYEARRLKLFGPLKPTAFEGVLSLDLVPTLVLTLKPEVAIVKPGEKVHIDLHYDVDQLEHLEEIMPDIDQNVYWKLEGPGKLLNMTADDVDFQAPNEECTVRIGVRVGDVTEYATIYVTDKKIGDDVTPH